MYTCNLVLSIPRLILGVDAEEAVDFGFVFGLIAHGSLYRMLAIISRCKRPRIVRLKEI